MVRDGRSARCGRTMAPFEYAYRCPFALLTRASLFDPFKKRHCASSLGGMKRSAGTSFAGRRKSPERAGSPTDIDLQVAVKIAPSMRIPAFLNGERPLRSPKVRLSSSKPLAVLNCTTRPGSARHGKARAKGSLLGEPVEGDDLARRLVLGGAFVVTEQEHPSPAPGDAVLSRIDHAPFHRVAQLVQGTEH